MAEKIENRLDEYVAEIAAQFATGAALVETQRLMGELEKMKMGAWHELWNHF